MFSAWRHEQLFFWGFESLNIKIIYAAGIKEECTVLNMDGPWMKYTEIPAYYIEKLEEESFTSKSRKTDPIEKWLSRIYLGGEGYWMLLLEISMPYSFHCCMPSDWAFSCIDLILQF